MMKKYRMFYMYLTLIFIGLSGCTEDIQFINDGSAYYSLEEGQERIYQVETITYSAANNEPKLETYYEKHVVTALNAKEYTYNASITIYSSADLQGRWNESGFYLVEKKPEEIVEIHNNQPKIIMKLPIRNGVNWNENIYNSLGSNSVSYDHLDEPITIDNDQWDQSIRVTEVKEKSTLIDYMSKYKVYVPSVGLVYAEDTALEYCQDSNCIGQYKIVSGYKYTKKLLR